MPLRAYRPAHPPCRLCGEGFEVAQAANAPALTTCPRCGQPVNLVVATPVSTPKITKPSSVSDAKSAGFTVLKRIAPGEYEKQ